MMAKQIKEKNKIDYQDIISRIPDHSREIWGEEPNERVLKGNYGTLSQIIHYNPTYAQVEKAIELIKIYAIEKGWI